MNHDEGLERVRKVIALEGEIRCRVCGQGILGPCVLCAACETPHHQDCWSYGEGCSVFGCRKTTRVEVTLPEEELGALRREVERRGRQTRIWQLTAGALGLVVLGVIIGLFTFLGRPTPLPDPVAVVSPVQDPSPAATSTLPVLPVALGFVFSRGQPTTPQEIIQGAFPEGGGELKMISISMEPVGAYVATIHTGQHRTALAEHGGRIHLTLPAGALPDTRLVARPALEEWTYRGRNTPLPAMRTKPLPAIGPTSWDVSELVRRPEDLPVKVVILPIAANFRVVREMKSLERYANVWLSIGDGKAEPPADLRVFPDLAITSMELEGAEIVVRFENRGKGGLPEATFDASLGAGGKRVLGSKSAPLSVPEPGQEAEARFHLDALQGMVPGPGPAMLTCEIDWGDNVPESDESNNVESREIVLPRIKSRYDAHER